MFSYHIKTIVKVLKNSNLRHKNGIRKITIKCDEFQYANYTFVHSFENEKFFLNKLNSK
jgi:hypothetical protein